MMSERTRYLKITQRQHVFHCLVFITTCKNKDCDQLSQIFKCMTLISHLFYSHLNCSKGFRNPQVTRLNLSNERFSELSSDLLNSKSL